MFSQSPLRQKSLITSQRRYDEMNLILPADQDGCAVYLGNLDAANDVSLLKTHNIGALMTLCPDPISSTMKSYLKFHQYYYAEDSEVFNLSQYFERSFEFIEKVRKQTALLIHCYAGISRSATILIAYIMKKKQIGVYEAMNLVQARRWQIYPNNGFLKQLASYEKKLFVYNNQGSEMKGSQQANSFREQFARASIGMSTSKANTSGNTLGSFKVADSLADWRRQLRSEQSSLFSSQKSLNRSFEEWKPLGQVQKKTEDVWSRKSKPLFSRLSLGSQTEMKQDRDTFESRFNSLRSNVEFASKQVSPSSTRGNNTFLSFGSQQRSSYQMPKKSYLNY